MEKVRGGGKGGVGRVGRGACETRQKEGSVKEVLLGDG